MILADLALVCLLGVPATAVALYPATMAVRSLALRGRRLSPPALKIPPPPLTVVISAFNEETSIRHRIENVLAMEYPAGLLHILVVSDGSADRTAELARSYSEFGVRVIEYAENLGKSGALAAASKHIETHLAVFTDANSRYDRDALLRLVRWFQYPDLGAVCGRLVYDRTGNSRVEAEEDRYWRWDNWIKDAESRTGHMVAGNGSILAIRTKLAEAIPSYLANDFAWLNIARLRGFKVCFDPTAIAREETAPTMRGEFRRRTRIMTRGLNAVLHAVQYHSALNPADRLPAADAAFFFSQLVCKKLFRYLAFPALLLAMLLAPFLSPGLPMALGACLWVLVSGLVAVGIVHPRMVERYPSWPNTLYHLAMASASLVAITRFLKGRRVSTWVPERPEPSVATAPALSDTQKAVA
ncbi:glycosyltransferase [bacterium]|nr:glycosyltransferase [bacterium]